MTAELRWSGQDGRLARWASVADIPLAALALLVIPIVLVEEQGGSAPARAAAMAANWTIWLAFVADLLLRWEAAEFRLRATPLPR